MKVQPLKRITIALVVFLFFSCYMLPILCLDEADSRIFVTDDHVLVYHGPTSDSNLETLKSIISASKTSIKAITIDSGGGIASAAIEIAQVLKALKNVPLRVDAKRVCASACVAILSQMPHAIEVAPTATIVFHAQIWRAGEARCPLCDVADFIRTEFQRPILSKDDRHVMAKWAEELSPHLSELIALCKVNPLDTYTGIALSGAEFNGLIDQSIAPATLVNSCPEHNVFYPQREDDRLKALITQQGTI